VSLPDSLAGFVENYRKKRGLNRSQVFEEAVKLLRSRELEAAYQEANAETDKEWENTIGDGLADEAW
jgi:antitoxin ParD1/3/4